jgi:hypothetical protein
MHPLGVLDTERSEQVLLGEVERARAGGVPSRPEASAGVSSLYWNDAPGCPRSGWVGAKATRLGAAMNRPSRSAPRRPAWRLRPEV